MKTKKWKIGALSLAMTALGTLGFSACDLQFGSAPAEETLYFQRIEGKDEYRVVGVGTVTAADIVIPATFKELPVTEIGANAFQGGITISSVQLPDSLTAIGAAAFEGCDAITDVILPVGLVSIGEGAFRNCTELSTLVVPATLQTVEHWAFDGCENLTTVYYQGAAEAWDTMQIDLYNAALEDAARYVYSAEEPSCQVDGITWHFADGEVEIWETKTHEWGETQTVAPTCSAEGYDVQGCLHCEAEQRSQYTEKTEHVWTNGTVAATCMKQGYDVVACENCDAEERSNFTLALGHEWGETQTVAPTCDEQGYDKKECGVCGEVEKSNFVDALGHGTMLNGNCDVCGDQLSTEGLVYELSAGGAYATVKAYTGTSSVVLIADKYQNVPVTAISEEAFKDCKHLTGFVTLEGIKTIGNKAFNGCTALTEITLPSTLTSLGEKVFGGCTALTDISVASDNTEFAASNGHLYTKDFGTLLQYALGARDNTFVTPNAMTAIAADAFAGAPYLQVVVFVNVTEIGVRAFENCAVLSRLQFHREALTKLGNSAFAKCTALQTVALPASVTEIGAWAFSDCKSLTSITLPASVTTIGEGAFFSCEKLTDVTLNEGLISIGANAFAWCFALKTITIPASVTLMGNSVFARCVNLIINCCASEQPTAWHETWNVENCQTNWAYTEEKTV